VTTQGSGTRIGRRPILVAVLAVAGVVGWILGALAGQMAQPPASPSPSLAPTSTLSPTVSASPPPSPTAIISISAEPDTSAAPVLQISDTGNKTTTDFEVRVGWQIDWQVDGKRFAIAVKGSRDLGTVVNVPGPASGVTSPPVDGTYHLEITATGHWSLKVIQGTG
jgi:hypothetical protein